MWWKAPWGRKGPAVAWTMPPWHKEQPAMTDTITEDAEATRRLEEFNRALGRAFSHREPQEAPYPVEPHRIIDPFPAKENPTRTEAAAIEVDSRLWQKLLREAFVDDVQSGIDPAAGLYWQLYTVRSWGAELEPYKPRLWVVGNPLEWRIVPGPDYLGGKEAYEKDRAEFLVPFAARLVPLLAKVKLYARKESKDG